MYESRMRLAEPLSTDITPRRYAVRQGWKQYFAEHVPEPIDWDPMDADLLWTQWRIGLVKHETPLRGISVTHGQPQTHWYREPDGTLCINLESMWDAFEGSVESFISLLERDAARRDLAVSRWQGRSWTVRPLVVPAPVPFPVREHHRGDGRVRNDDLDAAAEAGLS